MTDAGIMLVRGSGLKTPERRRMITADDVGAVVEEIEYMIGGSSCTEHRDAIVEFAIAALGDEVAGAAARGRPAVVTVNRNNHVVREAGLASIRLENAGSGDERNPADWWDYRISPFPERFVRTDSVTLLAAANLGIAVDRLTAGVLDHTGRSIRRLRVGLKGELPCFEVMDGNRMRTRLDLGDGMVWDGGRIVTPDVFPVTMVMAMKGMAASTLSSHPAMSGEDHVIKKVSAQATRTMIVTRTAAVLLDREGNEIDMARAVELGAVVRRH